MVTIKPIKDFVMIFPQDEGGNEIKFRFMLALKKRVSEPIMNAIASIEGIDNLAVAGRYTIEVVIARTFDPDQVIEAIQSSLAKSLSDIVTPELVLPK